MERFDDAIYADTDMDLILVIILMFFLAYILAEEGFDVWMGNARGNAYSRRHVSLNPDSILNTNFWKFSWDEIGNFDLPAMIDYVLEATNEPRLHYIGHSQVRAL